LDAGLSFNRSRQDIHRQFEAAQSRLTGEPLADYVFPFGAGYFLVVPSARDSSG
jgi:deferrochelatase/peroxidase EfeB